MGNVKKPDIVDSNKIVAYFDFDGTITTKDTLLPFVLYVVGWGKILSNLPVVLMIVFLYCLKIFDNAVAKEYFLTVMIKGIKQEVLEKKAMNFANNRIDKYIKEKIFARLIYHLEHHHQVILVSANLGIYLRYWALKHHLDGIIATELEFINEVATGKLATKNCYGKYKISRINDYLAKNQLEFSYKYGYGNSSGDYALLAYVDEGYWVSDCEIISWEDYRGYRK